MNNIFFYHYLRSSVRPFFSITGLLFSLMTYANDGFVDVDNINVSGKLVVSTCEIIDESESYLVDFSEVNVKDIYSSSSELTKEFVITAKNCQPGNELTMNFSGEENDMLPGLLSISGQAKGIGIGLKSGGVNGTPVLINSDTNIPGSVKNDDVTFLLSAYIKGEPLALKNKNVILGDFTAIANFTLRYE